ncbi:MAG: hypothetical protein E6R03_05860 [Hyphomicrobiaceae bacterium]|nr:MAG: hypothetical protein E6R03_05860 [Hyphomicrobiaceae bacterium]
MNFDHIEHFGVPGMRWGVRKQNPNKLSKSEKKELKRENKELEAEAYSKLREIESLTAYQVGSKKWATAVKDHETRVAEDPRYEYAVSKAQRSLDTRNDLIALGGSLLIGLGLDLGFNAYENRQARNSA